MTDAESLAARGMTVAEHGQWVHCASLVKRRDVTDNERRTAMRRLAALRAICQKRVFG